MKSHSVANAFVTEIHPQILCKRYKSCGKWPETFLSCLEVKLKRASSVIRGGQLGLKEKNALICENTCILLLLHSERTPNFYYVKCKEK